MLETYIRLSFQLFIKWSCYRASNCDVLSFPPPRTKVSVQPHCRCAVEKLSGLGNARRTAKPGIGGREMCISCDDVKRYAPTVSEWSEPIVVINGDSDRRQSGSYEQVRNRSRACSNGCAHMKTTQRKRMNTLC